MVLKRGSGSQGSDTDEKTVYLQKGDRAAAAPGDAPTEMIDGAGPETPTQPSGGAAPGAASGAAGGEPKTTIFTGGGKGPSPSPQTGADSDAMSDPVVGWLAIVKGPGRGSARAIGYGQNDIGRGPDERVSLNFGDTASDSEISRSNHATLTYDPRGRRFYISPGSGRNLTYMGDEPVLAPTELEGGEEITLGRTTLRFVPLCGKTFDWHDGEDADGE